MKINGEEQVNIGTEEEPFYVPKSNPFPRKVMKQVAKDWANKISENEKIQDELNKEFLNHVVFGKTPYYGNLETFEDLKDYAETELNMSPSDIVGRFSEHLTDEEIKELENYGK